MGSVEVIREDERDWVPFSGTSRFAFVSRGGAGEPEFFEEHSARGDGAPLHSHPWPSWEIVLAGTVRFVVDGSEHRLGPGDTIFTPPDVPHAYVVESDSAHVVGVGMSEGRFHRLQTEAAPILTGDGPPDMAALGALAASCNVQLLGPPPAP